MKSYNKVEVSEQQLEDLLRQYSGKMEEGLVWLDHQKRTPGGRLDVLMVDSGKSLVVAELKVVQDDGMLMQGVDYYDYISTQVEVFARLYKKYEIDPTQQVRLFLIAPFFSQILVDRCKWMDLPISLFTFHCLEFEDDPDIVPIFIEQPLPAAPAIVEVMHLDDHLMYITDVEVRERVAALLDEIKTWRPGNISLDPIKYAISIKVNGHLFAYLKTRRKYYLLETYNDQDEWIVHSIKDDDGLARVKPMMKEAMERRVT